MLSPASEASTVRRFILRRFLAAPPRRPNPGSSAIPSVVSLLLVSLLLVSLLLVSLFVVFLSLSPFLSQFPGPALPQSFADENRCPSWPRCEVETDLPLGASFPHSPHG